eukprot:13745500-Alexandrium_andersonii.AAC.1
MGRKHPWGVHHGLPNATTRFPKSKPKWRRVRLTLHTEGASHCSVAGQRPQLPWTWAWGRVDERAPECLGN